MKYLVVLFTLGFFGLSAQSDTSYFQVGDTVPAFKIQDQFGEWMDTEQWQGEQSVLIVFFRGHWCPYCKRHISELEEQLNKFESKSVKVLLVTPEQPEYAQEIIKSEETKISIVSDTTSYLMDLFQLRFEVNDTTVTKYYDFVYKKSSESNGTDKPSLPVPATFLVDKDGVIRYVHYNVNYKERSSFLEILKFLDE